MGWDSAKDSEDARLILVYLDARGVKIPILSTGSISNCKYHDVLGKMDQNVPSSFEGE